MVNKLTLPADAPFASVVRLRGLGSNQRTKVLLTDHPEPALDGVVCRTGFRVRARADGEFAPSGEETMWILDPDEPIEIVAEDIHSGLL